jgi:hypothetical protein
VGRWTARIGWFVAAVAPPLVGFWQHIAAGHPVVAGVAVVVYEGVLGVGGAVATRWRDRLVDRVDNALGRRFSSFDRRYREFVSGSLRYIDVKGLATIGFYTPELDEVFVDVRVAPSPPSDVSASVLSDEPANGFARRMLSDFLDGPQPSVIAIIGGPGVGKTTLLLHTARQACRQRKRKRSVPILLFLRDHVSAILANRDVTLPDVVRDTLGRYRADEPTGWLEHCLDNGSCVVLLDGLDEVAGQADRRALADWVEYQIRQYPKNDYVITSRPHGYLTARIDGATVLHALRLTDEQVTRLANGWFRALESAVERYNRPMPGELTAAERADKATDDLLGRLALSTELYELTANPMLLTMVVNVHRFRGQLPGSRAELFAEICQVMLGRRQEAKNLPVELGADKKEMVLRGLAFELMCRRVRDLNRADAVGVVEPLLGRVPGAITADAFLAEVAGSGILVERENGLFSFAHLTFQEYLAAAHIREKGLTQVLTDAVDDVWWRETTLLYATRSDADPIISACLASDGVAALSLAFDCEAQPSEIAPELRARLKRLLDSAVDPETEPHRRRLMAGVMIARHLRHRTLTADGSWVCAQPVTTNLYRLFLKETQSQPPDEPWLSGPDGDRPILGVYGRETSAFARWVNTVTEGDPTCRLPTRAELADPVVRRVLTASGSVTTWLHSTSGDPELWFPPGHGHPYTVDGDVLAEHILSDARGLTSTLAHLLLLRSMVVLPAITYARASALAGAAPFDDVLATELNRALDLAGDLDSALDLAHSRELLRDLDTDGARALGRSRARARALTRDSRVDFLHALARMADNSDAHTRAEAQAGDTASVGDSSRANARTRELIHDLTQSLDLARSLVRHSTPAEALALDVALGRGLGLARSLDTFLLNAGALDQVLTSAFDTHPTLALVRSPDRALARLAGKLLATALSTALARATKAGDWHTFQTDFGQALVTEAGIADQSTVVRPDELAEHVTAAEARLQARPDAPGSWHVQEIAGRLATLALPIFTWQQPLTPTKATAIRLAALSLATEVDDQHLSGLFLAIANGVTLLERRTDGRAPLTETIILATSEH